MNIVSGVHTFALIIVNPEANEYYKNPTFYALGHFSKFLPPGTQRVGINPEIFDNEKGNLQSGLFERPDGGNVLIVINSLNDQQVFTIDDLDFGALRMLVQLHSFNTWIYYR